MSRAKDGNYTLEQREILEGLGSKQIGYRLATERRLQQMGPEASDLLLQVLKELAAQRKLRTKIFFGCLAGFGALGVTIVAVALISNQPIAMVGLSGLSGIAGLSGLVVPQQRYYQVINALSQLNDVRAVGALADALSLQDSNSRTAVARALLRLLPLLGPEDGALLDAPQRIALQKLLSAGVPDKETELMLTVLRALQRIEDVTALSTMEMLAARVPHTDNEREITTAAAAAVVDLKLARENHQSHQQLLRASESSTAPSQLLRASYTSPETPAEQLLRAGNGPDHRV